MMQLIVFATMWVALLNFLLVFKCQPYVRRKENHINNLVQGALLALLLSAMGLSLEEAQQNTKWLRPALLTFCATVLLSTMAAALIACVLSLRARQVEKHELLATAQHMRESAEGGKPAGEQREMFDNPMLVHDDKVAGEQPTMHGSPVCTQGAAPASVAQQGFSLDAETAPDAAEPSLAASHDVQRETLVARGSLITTADARQKDSDGEAMVEL